MKQVIDFMLNELREEASITKRVLERVPAEKLAWKPHPKSMSLGQLAFHVASIPGNLARLVQMDEFDAAQTNFQPPVPSNLKEIHSTLDQSVHGGVPGWHYGTASDGQLAAHAKRTRSFQQAAIVSSQVDPAESLVPSSRPAIGLPPVAECSGPCNLRPKRG